MNPSDSLLWSIVWFSAASFAVAFCVSFIRED